MACKKYKLNVILNQVFIVLGPVLIIINVCYRLVLIWFTTP